MNFNFNRFDYSIDLNRYLCRLNFWGFRQKKGTITYVILYLIKALQNLLELNELQFQEI